MDAITSIESSTFVTSTLGLRVESEEGGSTFPDVNDRIVPAGTAAVTQGAYEDIPAVPAKWGYMSGAQMAAPHVTGTAALIASKYPALLSKLTDLKQVVLSHGKPLSATAGKTLTGQMPDANAAFTKPTIAFPTPTSSTTDRTPTIIVTVKDFQTNLTMAYITLRVDGVATTGSASYDAFPDRLSYTPTTNRMLGTHKVEVTAKDANGYSVYRLWTFNIVR